MLRASRGGVQLLPLSQRAKFGITGGMGSSLAMFTNLYPVNPGLDQAQSMMGVVMPIVNIYLSFDSTTDGHQNSINQIGSQGSILCVTFQPQKTNSAVLFTDITAGVYDSYIMTWINVWKNFPNKVYVRFAHEMNGNFYPWSVPWAGSYPGVSTTAQYIAGWRHVANLIHTNSTNVYTYFCPNGNDVGGTTMESYWPGNLYVDILGIDAYYGYDGTQSFDAIMKPMYDRLMTLSPTMDLWVGETGAIDTQDGGTSTYKAAWATAMFASTNFPNMKAVIYFDAKGGRTWYFETSSASQTAFAAGYQSCSGAIPYVAPDPANYPGAPSNIAASVSGQSATISFNPSVYQGGSAITSYVAYSSDNNHSANGTGSPLTITNLSLGVGVQFSVYAVNSYGPGPSGTPTSKTYYPANAPSQISSVMASANGSGHVTLTFTTPSAQGASITSYNISSSVGQAFTYTGSEGPITITGVNMGSTTFTVAAVNRVGQGTPSPNSNSIIVT